jgi:hypothetical protein
MALCGELMKNLAGIIFLTAFGVGFSLLVSAATEQLRPDPALNFTRDCRYINDNIQIGTVPSASTGAAVTLNGGSKYRMYCSTATYFDQEPSGGTGTATSADAQVAAATELKFWVKTGDTMNLRAVAATGSCDLLECL